MLKKNFCYCQVKKVRLLKKELKLQLRIPTDIFFNVTKYILCTYQFLIKTENPLSVFILFVNIFFLAILLISDYKIN